MDNLSRKSLNALELQRNISHAVQSPVSSILNLTELVLSGVEGDVNHEVRQDVTDIVDDMKRLEAVLARLLELCRIDLVEPDVKSVDVLAVIDAVLKKAEPEAKLTGQRLSNSIPNDLPMVKADAELMTALLERLIMLMARFTEEEHICVSAFASGDRVTVGVGGGGELSGPSPIYVVELPEAWRKDELALDWLICKRLAEHQGGVLWVNWPAGDRIALNLSLPFSD